LFVKHVNYILISYVEVVHQRQRNRCILSTKGDTSRNCNL